MVDDKIFDEVLDLAVVGTVDAGALLGGEDDVLDSLHLCGRACQTYLLGVGVDVCGTPLLQLEVGTLLEESLLLDEDHAFFDMSRPAIVFDTPCTKRFMRITFLRGATGGNLLALNNIDFYGTKEQMPEMKAVALGFESVSDEETRSESAPGRYAVDGNENTFWHSRYSGGNVAYPHSITLSNNTGARIDAITLMQRSMNANSLKYDAACMEVYAGDDKNHMDSIATVRLPFYVESTLQLPVSIDKKYFTLKFTRSQAGSSPWLAIREIKAYQINGTTDGIQNIEMGQGAESSAYIYDLTGRCMGTNAKALPAGIYIKGGKKYVVK